MKIVLGKSGGRNVELDLDILLRTRLLIQANSGGGKSFLLRRIAEQFFGKIPVIIIDPEGEFATLREKFGYVLVGKGGETPADPRSAGLLAQKLLELRASAVCDLYEMKVGERHRWVRLFLESLIDAPKKLWRPTLVIVDEAHSYAPEKGAGESEASDAMISLATRGRKRGFTPVFATQRLGKLRKDAAAELLNVLIGQTFVDIDRKRAADCLGVTGQDVKTFFDQIKILKPGQFYALGRAVSLERVLFGVGPIQTTHPEPGSSMHSAEPPPPPEKVKALLPKLADLPKAAEEQARTMTELKQEIRSLKGQLRAQPGKAETKEVVRTEVPVKYRRALEEAMKFVVKIETTDVILVDPEQVAKAVKGAVEKTVERINHEIAARLKAARRDAIRVKQLIGQLSDKGTVDVTVDLTPGVAYDFGVRASRIADRLIKQPWPKPHKITATNGDESLGKCETAILATLAQHGECDIGRLALLSGYRKSGGFKNSISRLRGLEYLDGPNTGVMQITEAGSKVAEFDALPTGRDLFEFWLNSPRMGVCEREIMKMLDGRRLGNTLEEIAEGTGYAISGGFKNSLSKLRTAGVIVGRNTERMRLSEELL